MLLIDGCYALEQITLQQFQDGLKQAGIPLSSSESEELFNRIDYMKTGKIDYLAWMDWVSSMTVRSPCLLLLEVCAFTPIPTSWPSNE